MEVDFLYSGSEKFDIIHLLKYINDFTASIGMEDVEIDLEDLQEVIFNINNDFPHCDGIEKASVFKKTAYFVANFVCLSPIKTKIKDDNPYFKSFDFSKIPNSENAIAAYFMAKDMLEGATIEKKDGVHTLDNPIVISIHSFIDIIDALATSTPEKHWQLLSLLFEQLAYKDNPDKSYTPVI